MVQDGAECADRPKRLNFASDEPNEGVCRPLDDNGFLLCIFDNFRNKLVRIIDKMTKN